MRTEQGADGRGRRRRRRRRRVRRRKVYSKRTQ
jgi:hypothetical protein